MEGWELRRERKSWCRELEKRSKVEMGWIQGFGFQGKKTNARRRREGVYFAESRARLVLV